MASKRVQTSAVLFVLLLAGCILLGAGIALTNSLLMVTGGVLCLRYVISYILSQRTLKEKCELMLEAIRNNDYAFRLPASAFSAG